MPLSRVPPDRPGCMPEAAGGAANCQEAHPAAPDPLRVRFDAFELDEANALLVRDGSAVAVAPRPFAVLCALARRPGCLVTKHALLDQVWGHHFVSESVLKTAVSEVRTVLDDHPRQPRFIETVSRRGYRFIASTTPISTMMSVREIGLSGQAPFKSRLETPPLPAAAGDGAFSWKHDVVCVDGYADPLRREVGFAYPPPAYATTDEVSYAHELKLQLRARLLRDAASAPTP